MLANSCFQAVNVIGYPEAELILAHCAIYLACSPKSNSSYLAIKKAKSLVQETGDLSIPLALRNAPTSLMKEQGYGEGYKYAHQYAGNFADMEFLPEEIKNTLLYEPSNNPRENEIKERLRRWWRDKYGY